MYFELFELRYCSALKL